VATSTSRRLTAWCSRSMSMTAPSTPELPKRRDQTERPDGFAQRRATTHAPLALPLAQPRLSVVVERAGHFLDWHAGLPTCPALVGPRHHPHARPGWDCGRAEGAALSGAELARRSTGGSLEPQTDHAALRYRARSGPGKHSAGAGAGSHHHLPRVSGRAH